MHLGEQDSDGEAGRCSDGRSCCGGPGWGEWSGSSCWTWGHPFQVSQTPQPPRLSSGLVAGFYPCLFFSPYDPESFSCEGQDYGYYADVASGCEVSLLVVFGISQQIFIDFFLRSSTSACPSKTTTGWWPAPPSGASSVATAPSSTSKPLFATSLTMLSLVRSPPASMAPLATERCWRTTETLLEASRKWHFWRSSQNAELQWGPERGKEPWGAMYH